MRLLEGIQITKKLVFRWINRSQFNEIGEKQSLNNIHCEPKCPQVKRPQNSQTEVG